MRKTVCDMRGFLSLLVRWLLSNKPMTGAEIAKEIEKRKGCKPNPGTIYPALKQLLLKKAIVVSSRDGKEKTYALTALGRRQTEIARNAFCKTFYDVFTRS